MWALCQQTTMIASNTEKLTHYRVLKQKRPLALCGNNERGTFLDRLLNESSFYGKFTERLDCMSFVGRKHIIKEAQHSDFLSIQADETWILPHSANSCLTDDKTNVPA